MLSDGYFDFFKASVPEPRSVCTPATACVCVCVCVAMGERYGNQWPTTVPTTAAMAHRPRTSHTSARNEHHGASHRRPVPIPVYVCSCLSCVLSRASSCVKRVSGTCRTRMRGRVTRDGVCGWCSAEVVCAQRSKDVCKHCARIVGTEYVSVCSLDSSVPVVSRLSAITHTLTHRTGADHNARVGRIDVHHPPFTGCELCLCVFFLSSILSDVRDMLQIHA